jgi:acyl-[acyl-carrier-protein]-phospholipid O-acyltransferase/long-chain-fatty-acid--[acyl-carrier-protein] ligase
VTNEPRLTLDALGRLFRARGFSNLAVPRELKVIREIPRLGTARSTTASCSGLV